MELINQESEICTSNGATQGLTLLPMDQRGWLMGLRWVASPHWDLRPSDSTVDLLVIHGISLPPGEYGGGWIEALFTGTLPTAAHPYFASLAGLRVSAHLLIQRSGVAIQFVSLHHRAWHAGVSQFGDRTACNDFSLGIELEGTDTEPYTDVQYATLALLTRSLQQAFPAITLDRIVGHSTIAPGRKTDPGPSFDWERFRLSIQGNNY